MVWPNNSTTKIPTTSIKFKTSLLSLRCKSRQALQKTNNPRPVCWTLFCNRVSDIRNPQTSFCVCQNRKEKGHKLRKIVATLRTKKMGSILSQRFNNTQSDKRPTSSVLITGISLILMARRQTFATTSNYRSQRPSKQHWRNLSASQEW